MVEIDFHKIFQTSFTSDCGNVHQRLMQDDIVEDKYPIPIRKFSPESDILWTISIKVYQNSEKTKEAANFILKIEFVKNNTIFKFIYKRN